MVELADDAEMAMRKPQAERFFAAIGISEEYRPVFVSDEAALYDIQLEDDALVINRVRKHYGVTITTDDFRVPFWLS